MSVTGEFSPGAFLEGLAAAFSAQASTPKVAEGALAFRQAINNATLFDYSPRSLPVVAQLHDRLEPLVAPHRQHLPWVASPRGTDDGSRIALAPLNLMIDLGEVVAGILITGANETYPEHQHSPQEIYLVLAGNGMWRYGGHEQYEPIQPGATLYNPPGVTHGVRAGIEAVLAAYVLWPEASAEGDQADAECPEQGRPIVRLGKSGLAGEHDDAKHDDWHRGDLPMGGETMLTDGEFVRVPVQ